MACSRGNVGKKFAEAPDPALVERFAGSAAVEPEGLQRRRIGKKRSRAGSQAHPLSAGKKNSSRSPQAVQRKSWLAEPGVAPQAMQRRRETVSAVRVIDKG